MTTRGNTLKKENKLKEEKNMRLSNSYTISCPPIRGDNPRALASGLSYVQVDKHGITNYTAYISVDLTHHMIFCA